MENTPQTLETLIHRELSKLPDRPAPETLIPSVLAQIRVRQLRHWWQRPWTQWPSGAQFASVPFLMTSASGTIFGLTMLWNLFWASSPITSLSERAGSFAPVWEVLGALANAVLLLTRAVGQEYLLIAVFIAISMYLTCVGLGTLCYRMAFHHR